VRIGFPQRKSYYIRGLLKMQPLFSYFFRIWPNFF